LASADSVMEDGSPIVKPEQPPTAQSMIGRFNVPIAAAQPQQQGVQSPFSQPPPPPPALAQSQPVPQQLAQPVTQSMSPSTRPLRAPFGYGEREREPILQPPSRTPLTQKAAPQVQAAPVSEPPPIRRHPLPGSLVDPQVERQKVELKPAKEQPRQQERTHLHVKQEPDPYDRMDPYTAQMQTGRFAPRENLAHARPPEPPPRAPVPQAPFSTILQQQPSRGGVLTDLNPSPPAPSRPLSTLSSLSRPMSESGGPSERYNTPPAPRQRTPPVAAMPAVAPRPAEPRKTSSIMSLLNDDPPPPPKRVSEMPGSSKPSSTPPPSSNLSRPPPPPPPPSSHIRRETPMADNQAYGPYGRNPPPAPSSVSSIPSLKPYTTASPQSQPLSAPRHMVGTVENERHDQFFSRQRQYPSPHQPAAGSPQSTHHYPPHGQPAAMSYQNQGYPYGGPAQPPTAASPPPPQYGGHPSAPRGHEPPPAPGRDMGWSSSHPSHAIQQQQQQQSWPPQQPKSTQPPPAQSPWAAQHATTAPKPPPPSTSVAPQPSWAAPQPRGHDPRDGLNLRDNRDPRDMYAHRSMQPSMQPPYVSASRAPEPPPQAPTAYSRFSNTPGPGRDPRDPNPPRSYTPVSSYDSRGAYPPPSQDMREAQIREQQLREQQQLRDQQQQSILHQQLRPQDPNRNLYDRPPDRYGR
jgi:hypothetical protein